MPEDLQEILEQLRASLTPVSEEDSALDESHTLNLAMEWANSYHHRFERIEGVVSEAEKSLGRLLKDPHIRNDKELRLVLIRMLGVSSTAATDLKNLILQCESLMKGEVTPLIK